MQLLDSLNTPESKKSVVNEWRRRENEKVISADVFDVRRIIREEDAEQQVSNLLARYSGGTHGNCSQEEEEEEEESSRV